jgi:hypothetical protein
MADLNLDLGYFQHLKTKRIVKALGRGADVLPLRLWCYTGQHYALDGRLAGHAAEDIEAAVDWWGKSGEMVKAMVEIRHLDVDADGTYMVHGWLERSGHLAAFQERARKAAKARWGNKDACSMLEHPQASTSNAPTNLPTNPPTNPKGSGRAPRQPLGEIPDLPLSLQTAAMKSTWADFIEHRRKLRKPLSKLAAERIYACFSKWGEQKSLAAMNHSIMSGYQGIFEPSDRPGSGTATQSSGSITSKKVFA